MGLEAIPDMSNVLSYVSSLPISASEPVPALSASKTVLPAAKGPTDSLIERYRGVSTMAQLGLTPEQYVSVGLRNP